MAPKGKERNADWEKKNRRKTAERHHGRRACLPKGGKQGRHTATGEKGRTSNQGREKEVRRPKKSCFFPTHQGRGKGVTRTEEEGKRVLGFREEKGGKGGTRFSEGATSQKESTEWNKRKSSFGKKQPKEKGGLEKGGDISSQGGWGGPTRKRPNGGKKLGERPKPFLKSKRRGWGKSTAFRERAHGLPLWGGTKKGGK